MSPSVGGLALTCSQPGTQLVCAKERAVEQAVNLQAWGRSMGPCLTFSESSVTAHLHKGTLNDNTSPLETYHVGKAHRKTATWAAQSREDSRAPRKPSACYQDPTTQGLHASSPTVPPGTLPPITGHISHPGLLGDRGHCRHPPVHPTQSSVLDYPHIEPNPGCSHFSPSLSLCQAGLNHTGPSLPP